MRFYCASLCKFDKSETQAAHHFDEEDNLIWMQLFDVDSCATIFQACKTGQSHNVRGSERGHTNDVGDELDGLEEQSQANHVVIRAESSPLDSSSDEPERYETSR